MNIYFTLLVLSSVLSLVGLFWLVIVAFKRSVFWGVLVLLFSPISAIVFSLMNWFDARKAFIFYMVTFLLFGGTMVFIVGQLGVGNMQQIANRLQTGKLKPNQAYQLIDKVLRQGRGDGLFVADSTTDVASPAVVKPSTGQVAALPVKSTQLAQNQTQTTDAPKPAAVPHKVKPEPQTTHKVADAKPKSKSVDSSASTNQAASGDQADSDAGTQTDDDSQSSVPNLNQVPPDPLQQKSKVLGPKMKRVSLGSMPRYIGRYFVITLKSGSTHRGLLRRVEKRILVLERKLYGGKFTYRIRKDEIKSIRLFEHVPVDEQ